MLQTTELCNFTQKITIKHDHKFIITENNNINISKHKIKIIFQSYSFYFNKWLFVKKCRSHTRMHQYQGMAGNMVDIPSTNKQVLFKFTSVYLLLFLVGKNNVLLQL